MKLTKHDKILLDLTKKSYDKIAADFSSTRQKTWPDLKVFLDYIKAGDDVLDLGCGNGRLYDLFKDKTIRYFGVDSSKKLIKEAKKKYPQAIFKVTDARNLKLKEKFDAVLCVAMLNHLPSNKLQLEVLRNIFHALKPGGYLLMSNWNLYNTNNKKNATNFKKIKNITNVSTFKKVYGVAKGDLREKDVLTKWANQGILYYYAFDHLELDKLLKQVGFKKIKNFYSVNDQFGTRKTGRNIVSIYKKID